MSRRTLGLLVAAIGIALTAVAALADQVGIGASDDFGWKQLLGVVLGVAITVLGYVIATADEEPADDGHADT